LREIAAEKNAAFRRRFLGQRLTVVTLGDGSRALSDNYIQVELARPHEPNRLIDVEVDSVTDRGVRERGALRVVG
jgi:hypothetical protein